LKSWYHIGRGQRSISPQLTKKTTVVVVVVVVVVIDVAAAVVLILHLLLLLPLLLAVTVGRGPWARISKVTGRHG